MHVKLRIRPQNSNIIHNPDYAVRRVSEHLLTWPERRWSLSLRGLPLLSYEGKGKACFHSVPFITLQFRIPSSALKHRYDDRKIASFEDQTSEFAVSLLEYELLVITRPEIQNL
jgi:hypothetical protein